jgi:lipopolysaccharide/colanic/teichoic acid biosynthesis glycosyltransferase
MKRAFDLTVATIGFIATLPLLALLALLVRASSRGPALFVQTRIGRHGKPFLCVKFRTMRMHADSNTVTVDGDKRITGIGNFLRKTKLDELPQLWNVMTGRMSFVGPRPDVPGYADRLEGDNRRILNLRPGITGPATLLFRREEELLASADDPVRFNDEVLFPEKARINLEYADRLSFWRDIGYITATVCPPLTRLTGLDRRLGLDYENFEKRMREKLTAECTERTRKREKREN